MFDIVATGRGVCGKDRGKTCQAARHLVEFMLLVPHSPLYLSQPKLSTQTIFLNAHEFHKSDFLELNQMFL